MAQETRTIKSKISSVKNIKKITKAMEMVAASKMKKMVAKTLATRPYADYAFELLVNLSKESDVKHPLLVHGQDGKVLLVIVTSNKGLCGSYNVAVARSVAKFMKNHPDEEVVAITVGRYAERLARRLKLDVRGSFVDFSDNLHFDEIKGLFRLLHDEFTGGNYHRALVVYTHFVSALSYKPTMKQLLPISQKSIRNLLEDLAGSHEEVSVASNMSQYLFEPDVEEVYVSILGPLVKAILYEMMLESLASEHSARMFAMRNASDNADRVADDLTLSYNRARQEGITQEISEIVSGSAFNE